MKETESTIVAREFLCHQEGILKAQFCVVDRFENPEVDNSQKVATSPYKDYYYMIPTLLAKRINETDRGFNETTILLKKHMGSLQAYIVDEGLDEDSNIVLFEDADHPKEEELEGKVLQFVESAKNFYKQRFIVETYKENLQLCWSPFGELKDILKNNESLNIEVSGDFQPDIIQDNIIKARRGIMMLAAKTEHFSKAMLYLQTRKDALSLCESLKKNINLDKATTVFFMDQKESQDSTQAKKESWFLNLSFYDNDYDENFELRFPNEHCYLKALDLIRESKEVRIVQHIIDSCSFSSCLENELFYSEAREDPEETRQGRYSKTQFKSWILYMKANTEQLPSDQAEAQPEKKGRRRHEIKKIMDKLLNQEIDYALLFADKNGGRGSLDADSVDAKIFRHSFKESFKELKYINESSIKYFIKEGQYSTPLVTVVTQSQSTLKDILQTLLEHYKNGQREEAIQFNTIARNREYFCFAKMGRLRHEEVHYDVVKKFKQVIVEFQKHLRVLPSLFRTNKIYKLYSYCCFHERDGLRTLDSLCKILKPRELRFTIEKSKMSDLLKKMIKEETKKILSDSEIMIPHFKEDSFTLLVYSSKKEEHEFTQLCKDLQGKVSQIVEAFWKKPDSIPFSGDEISQLIPMRGDNREEDFVQVNDSFLKELGDFNLKKEIAPEIGEMADSHVEDNEPVGEMDKSNIQTDNSVNDRSKTASLPKEDHSKASTSHYQAPSILASMKDEARP